MSVWSVFLEIDKPSTNFFVDYLSRALEIARVVLTRRMHVLTVRDTLDDNNMFVSLSLIEDRELMPRVNDAVYKKDTRTVNMTTTIVVVRKVNRFLHNRIQYDNITIMDSYSHRTWWNTKQSFTQFQLWVDIDPQREYARSLLFTSLIVSELRAGLIEPLSGARFGARSADSGFLQLLDEFTEQRKSKLTFGVQQTIMIRTYLYRKSWQSFFFVFFFFSLTKRLR